MESMELTPYLCAPSVGEGGRGLACIVLLYTYTEIEQGGKGRVPASCRAGTSMCTI